MSHRRKQALGKGLGALLGTPSSPAAAQVMAPVPVTPPAGEAPASPPEQAQDGELRYVPVKAIRPNPRQPRVRFDPERLEELADSIREHGVLQPLLVTADEENAGGYILLAGERRLRAAEIAGLDQVPARVVTATDEERLEIAIIENVQRDDLNPVEEARAYQRLSDSFGYSQEQIAKRVGKSRVAIANTLRMLRLSEMILEDLEKGVLTPGHARALLMLHHPLQQEELRKEIQGGGLSVREAEERARKLSTGDVSGTKSEKKAQSPPKNDLDVVALEERLTVLLGCKVRLRTRNGKKGRLEIHYQNLDDLDRVLEKVGYDPDGS